MTACQQMSLAEWGILLSSCRLSAAYAGLKSSPLVGRYPTPYIAETDYSLSGWPRPKNKFTPSKPTLQQCLNLCAHAKGARNERVADKSTAPRGTAHHFQAKIPCHGSDNIIAWKDGLLDDDNEDCGGWCFAEDQEPPGCWTDGVCWASKRGWEAIRAAYSSGNRSLTRDKPWAGKSTLTAPISRIGDAAPAAIGGNL
jgi:hypothetical protein